MHPAALEYRSPKRNLKLYTMVLGLGGTILLSYCKFQAETLRRRRHELGMRVDGREFTDLTNVQLDGMIREVLGVTPSAGLRLVQGSLHRRGVQVQRARVLQSLRRVDPVSSTLRNA